jgi:hypothetical protein
MTRFKRSFYAMLLGLTIVATLAGAPRAGATSSLAPIGRPGSTLAAPVETLEELVEELGESILA